MFKYFSPFVIIFLSSIAAAKSFEIHRQMYNFTWDRKDRISVSESCDPSNRNSCIALKKLKYASIEKARQELINGTNPGVIICRLLKGESVLGYDKEGNQNSFCKFSDNSMVDSGTLTYYGIMNDRD